MSEDFKAMLECRKQLLLTSLLLKELVEQTMGIDDGNGKLREDATKQLDANRKLFPDVEI